MAECTSISWCDHTFNPIIGCAKVAPGCDHCYAEAFAKRYNKAVWGPKGTRAKTTEAYWRAPLKWNRDALRDGVRRRVFCASLADVFEDWDGVIVDHHGEQLFWPHNAIENARYIPERNCGGDEPPVTMDDLRRDLFALIDLTPHLDWMLLTKRPGNVRRMWPCPLDTDGDGDCHICHRGRPHYRHNVWLGCSVSDQTTADRNVPRLLHCCRDLCRVLFLSCEPLLGPINLCEVQHDRTVEINALNGDHGLTRPLRGRSEYRIDWVIVGGESGPQHRPMDADWARSLRDQCRAAGVPFFFKQGAARFSGRHVQLDGQIIQQFPEVQRRS